MDTAESERTQTIIFVRHGVALHNLRVGNIAPDLTNPYFLDPSLVPYGVQQAADAGEKIRRWLEQRHGRDRVDLALTSPLTRCFQSTFAILKMSREATECETKIVCCEDLREAYGLHYPDRRRSKSHLMEQWPQVQFDSEMSEQDEVWSETERETLDHLQHRVNRFLSTLVQQYSHYDNILVVSHGLWIEACLRGHCPEALPNGERVHNCDLFGGDCVSHQGSFVRLQNIRRIP